MVGEVICSLDPLVDDAEDDFDNDGLNNLGEFEYTTNPELNDSDSDGLLDGEEVYTYFTDPKDYDSDNDGLLDGEEVLIYLTDPKDYDSDNDKLNDGEEVNTYNTDPLDADSDDDQMPDGWEISNALNSLIDMLKAILTKMNCRILKNMNTEQILTTPTAMETHFTMVRKLEKVEIL